jgi:hypothetical protein
MPTDLYSNAFNSGLESIFLINPDNLNNPLDIILRNDECQFEKLQMDESVFNIYPSGTLIVRDIKDIVSYIQINNIQVIQLKYSDGSYRNLSLTSTSYINNAASNTEENFVCINFSNFLYKISQKYSFNHFFEENNKIYKIEHILEILDDKLKLILDNDYLVDTQSVIGIYNSCFNYFCAKILNAGNNNLNYSISDNVFQYLNYLSSMAVDENEKEPNFLFWTEFDDYINFKSFPILSNLKQDDDVVRRYEERNFRYTVYDADIPFQQATNGNVYKKIYSLSSDPTNQFVSKNYYYLRKTPKFLDNIPENLSEEEKLKYSTKALAFHFQDDSEKYNIEAISSNGEIGGVTGGADELFCEKDWGWLADFNTKNNHANDAFDTGDFGFSSTYSNIKIMGKTGYFSHSDTSEMWKNIFDITTIHPNYPDIAEDQIPDDPNEYKYNIIHKMLDNINQTSGYKNEISEAIRKIERENFVLYSLCCVNTSSEESFFANLIRYEPDPLTDVNNLSGVCLANPAWRYKWEKLTFDNFGATGASGGNSYWTYLEVWKGDGGVNCSHKLDDTWAINLNERTAGLGEPDYYPPGWVSTNLSPGFKYRPIGANKVAFNQAGDTIAHIVRMYKKPIEQLAIEGGVTIGTELRGKNLYYFAVENVVDGTCQ